MKTTATKTRIAYGNYHLACEQRKYVNLAQKYIFKMKIAPHSVRVFKMKIAPHSVRVFKMLKLDAIRKKKIKSVECFKADSRNYSYPSFLLVDITFA